MSPLNCPIPFSASRECIGCRHFWGSDCNHSIYSPIPINDILTTNERLNVYTDKKRTQGGEGYGVGRGTKEDGQIKQMRAMILFLQSKLNEHIDRHKSRLKDIF